MRERSASRAVLLLAILSLCAPPGADGQAAGKLQVVVEDHGALGFWGDGQDAAGVTVYYLTADGRAANRRIEVWFSWNHGDLQPHPLVIQPGGFMAKAKLTSEWPVDTKLALVNSSPRLDVQGAREFEVKFVPPKLVLLGPDSVSIVDNQTLTARFLDHKKHPTPAGVKRRITFVNKTSNIQLKPIMVDSDPSASDTNTIVIPAGLGMAEIEVSTPGYEPSTYRFKITALLVIGLCMIGGSLGGLVAFSAFRGSLPWRIFVGMIAAGVLVWAYVYGVLPGIDSAVAHNVISVFFISIIAGYLGIQVLNALAKRLGFA